MPTAFGQFQLLRRIATGGMGEIFLAHPKDPEKRVVIKRLLPHLLENEGFVGLFRDEARIVAHLNHPNIARLYEVGQVDGAWYLALEYVDGPDLRRVWQRAKALKVTLPIGAICRIIGDTAAALHYAHRARDSSGRPLEIVHRDVSPHNVLLGMDGRVKLIDFGIARATNRLERTETGLVRGKYSYMSPEHMSGGVVDARSDIFALGVVLWEALAGKRLFLGESELLTAHLVARCRVPPPSVVNPGIPPGLDAVCLKALQRDPVARYPDAEAMRGELEGAASGLAAPVGVAELASIMRGLFAASAPSTELSPKPESRGADFVATFHSLAAAAPSGQELAEREGSATVTRGPDLMALDGDEPPPDAPLLAAGPAQSWLPVSRAAFVGREKELLRLSSFFLCGERLVTTLGPAGSGKTRLALEYGARSLKAEVPPNPGGVLFCPLAETRDVGGICAELARTLGVELAGPDSDAEVRQLGAALASRGEVLLILDGFEQVARYALQTIGAWLELAARARLLVTSRATLSLEAELTLEVGGLEPGGEAVLAAAGSPALRGPIAGELLRRAGTLPLALELVGGQTWTSSAEGVLDRLPRGLARPLTASAAAEWAFGLLPADEQLSLARCSVFRGGFSREAAAAVLGPAAHLVLEQKRLLTAQTPPGEPGEERLSLHEALRELCSSKLRALGKEGETRQSHAGYFLRLAAAAEAELEGPEAATARTRISRERENLFAVFRHGLEGRPDGDGQLLASVVALDRLLSTEGPPALRLSMLETVLERVEGSGAAVEPSLLGSALLARGCALRWVGRVAEASADLNEALRLGQVGADVRLEGKVRLELSSGHAARGRVEAARKELEQVLGLKPLPPGLEVRARVGLGALALDAHDVAGAAGQLSQARSRADSGDAAAGAQVHLALHDVELAGGRLEPAVLELERAVAGFRQAGHGGAEGRALLGLAGLYRRRALFSIASQYYRAAAARLRGAGQLRLVAQALADHCSLDHELGRLPHAFARCQLALAAAGAADDRRLRGVLLARLGALLASLNRPAEAQASLEAADAQLRPLGDPANQTLVEVYRAQVELCLLASRGAAVAEVREGERGAAWRALLAEAERPPAEDGLRRGGPSSDPVREAARILRATLAP